MPPEAVSNLMEICGSSHEKKKKKSVLGTMWVEVGSRKSPK